MRTKSITLILPHETIKGLSRAEIYVADLILDLCRCTSKNTPSKALYSCVSQQWLAQRVGVTREWISKCVTKLAQLGILDITHRRKERGNWKTNLYRVGPALKVGYHKAKQLFFNAFSRVKSEAHKVVKNKTSSKRIKEMGLFNQKPSGKSFAEIMAHCHERLETLEG